MSDTQEISADCPFCGENNAVICGSGFDPAIGSAAPYAVSCRTVDCHGGIWALGHNQFATKAEAVAAWNRRAARSAQPGVVALVDAMAEAMWRHELDDLSPAASRTRRNSVWAEESDNTRAKWLLHARAAAALLNAPDHTALLRGAMTALEPLANLDIPEGKFRDQYQNGGYYSIRHSEIEAADRLVQSIKTAIGDTGK